MNVYFVCVGRRLRVPRHVSSRSARQHCSLKLPYTEAMIISAYKSTFTPRWMSINKRTHKAIVSFGNQLSDLNRT